MRKKKKDDMRYVCVACVRLDELRSSGSQRRPKSRDYTSEFAFTKDAYCTYSGTEREREIARARRIGAFSPIAGVDVFPYRACALLRRRGRKSGREKKVARLRLIALI